LSDSAGPSPAAKSFEDSEKLADRVQTAIQDYYQLEEAPRVGTFMRVGREGEREALRVRDAEDGSLELEVIAPPLAERPALDDVCQLIEGVSHFVYVAERARCRRPATQLELELQAEVDKYVLLVLGNVPFDAERAHSLHARLYEFVRFADAAGTEAGDRYRLANDLAARLVRRIERRYAQKGRKDAMRDALARFYRMGLGDKILFAQAD
jgi:hypothetical protein